MKFLTAFILFAAATATLPTCAMADGPLAASTGGVPVVGPSAQPLAAQVPTLPPEVQAPEYATVAEVAAPPSWVQGVLVSIQALPGVGPVVAKALVYVNILLGFLTALTGFLFTVIRLASGAFAWAGWAKATAWLIAFQNSKFLYWLKFISNFTKPKEKAAPVLAVEDRKSDERSPV